MAWTNEDVARQFAEIAALLRLRGEDRFRVRAYERAAAAIGAAPVDISTLSQSQLAQLKGIGASTARKINEYLTSGRLPMLEELRAQVPPGMAQLTRIPGLGPKTAQILFTELGVDSVEALREAIRTERLRGLPGLGAKTEEKLREALERVGAQGGSGDDDRLPMADGIALAEELCERLAVVPGVARVAFAGSLRRMLPTIGDVDILVASTDPATVMQAFRGSGLVVAVLAAGERKTSALTVRGLQADLRVVEPGAWGAAMVYFTGSKAHNIRIRERAVRRGLVLNEYGLFDDAQRRLAGATEAEVYEALGLQWVPPPMRSDTGEVEAAAQGALPEVVTLADLRGDLHGHSDWSGDGKASMEEMVAGAAARGHTYWAATDHAEDLTINGLSREEMLARRAHIARVQAAHPGIRILDGAELNIGLDGGLDYDLDFLAGFDFCVASIHHQLRRPLEDQTARTLKAMEHPAVTVIGHPTGRMLGRRPSFELDLDAVVAAAVRTGTALEVNASPRRLDLDGELVRRAVRGGATLAISCDAHTVGDLGGMRYGVAQAVRGWATPEHVLNCRDLDGLLAFAAAKRGRVAHG